MPRDPVKAARQAAQVARGRGPGRPMSEKMRAVLDCLLKNGGEFHVRKTIEETGAKAKTIENWRTAGTTTYCIAFAREWARIRSFPEEEVEQHEWSRKLMECDNRREAFRHMELHFGWTVEFLNSLMADPESRVARGFMEWLDLSKWDAEDALLAEAKGGSIRAQQVFLAARTEEYAQKTRLQISGNVRHEHAPDTAYLERLRLGVQSGPAKKQLMEAEVIDAKSTDEEPAGLVGDPVGPERRATDGDAAADDKSSDAHGGEKSASGTTAAA